MKIRLTIGRAWPEVEHVFAVGYRGLAVGRIWLATDRPGHREPWEWLLCLPLALPDDSRGMSASRDDALQAVAACLSQLISRTPHERLERAFTLATAIGLKFDGGEEIELSVEAASAAASPARPVEVRAEPVAAARSVQRVVVPAAVVAQRPAATPMKKRGAVVRVQVGRPQPVAKPPQDPAPPIIS